MGIYFRFLFSSSQHKPNKTSKTTSPAIALHVPSASTIKTVQKLPSFQSQRDHSTSNKQSSTNQLAPPTVVFHQSDTKKPVSISNKSVDNSKSLWNLDEINKFTREFFKLGTGNTSDYFSRGDHDKSNVHRRQIRLDW